MKRIQSVPIHSHWMEYVEGYGQPFDIEIKIDGHREHYVHGQPDTDAFCPYPFKPDVISGLPQIVILPKPPSTDHKRYANETDILKGLVRSLGGYVVEAHVTYAPGNTGEKEEQRSPEFIRDPVLRLGENILIPRNSAFANEQDDLLPMLRKLGFRIVEIDNSAAEGGNVLYSPYDRKLFYGIDDPDTDYAEFDRLVKGTSI